MTTTPQNILVLFRAATSRYHAAITVGSLGDDVADLVALSDGDDWEDSVPSATVARFMYSKARGTGVDEWMPVPATAEVAGAISAALSGVLAGYASETYVDGAVAGACQAPAAGSAVGTPTLGTSYHPSEDRPVLVAVYCDVALPSALLAAQSATVQLQAGPAINPSAVVGGPLTPTSGVGTAGALTVPVTFFYLLPADHYYQVVKSAGAGTVTITRIEQTVM